MAADIVPELLNKIETSFQSRMAKDATLRTIGKRIENGTALPADANNYAVRAGEALSGALQECLTAETLPDATLYYNIAMRTVEPTLRRNYDLVNQAAAQIQSIADQADGIGLKSVRADFPMGRVKGLVNQMCVDDIKLEEARKWLGEPIVNTTQSFHDDFVKENAKFRARAGMKVTIERRVSGGKPCKWCGELAGEYPYGSEPGEVYRRHENCRCTVTYKNSRGRQDVWTKERWWNVGADRDTIAARRQANLMGEQLSGELRQRALLAAQNVGDAKIPASMVGNFSDYLPLDLTEQEAKALRTLHERAQATGYEYGQILYDGGQTEILTSNLHDRVQLPVSEIDGKGLKVYHSHTNDTPPSVQDFVPLTLDKVDQIGVSSGNGDAWTVKIGDGRRPSVSELQRISEVINEEVDIDIRKDQHFYEWSVEERNYAATREQFYRIIREFGWEARGGSLDG